MNKGLEISFTLLDKGRHTFFLLITGKAEGKQAGFQRQRAVQVLIHPVVNRLLGTAH